MAKNQRTLIGEAKKRLRWEIPQEIAKLREEMYWLEQFIMKTEYVASVRKSSFTESWVKKRELGNKRKKSMLKVAMGGVRAN